MKKSLEEILQDKNINAEELLEKYPELLLANYGHQEEK